MKVDYIVQNDAGFMWIGTHYGLYRDEGYAFKALVRDPGNPNSLDCEMFELSSKIVMGALGRLRSISR